jgi:hypothetical protein
LVTFKASEALLTLMDNNISTFKVDKNCQLLICSQHVEGVIYQMNG